MAMQIMQQAEQVWPAMAGVIALKQSCGGNTWSKRLASAMENDFWEVRAFAEDASSSEAQWPPRSYSCSFCQRKFRTAQALGGHMNVHRREKAQAKQLAQLRHASSQSSRLASPPKMRSNDHAGSGDQYRWVQFMSVKPRLSSEQSPTRSHTADLFSPKSLSSSQFSLSMSGPTWNSSPLSSPPPSHESTSSSESSELGIPNIFCEALSQQNACTSSVCRSTYHYTPRRSAYHPYEKSKANTVVRAPEDTLDLELRLG